MKQKDVITREQQRTEDTWDLTDLYTTDEAYQEAKERLEKMTQELTSLQGTLEEGAEQLLQALCLYEQAMEVFEALHVYANQRYHQDTTNAKYQKMSGEMQVAGANLMQAVSWLEPELLAILQDRMDAYFAENPEYIQKDGTLCRNLEFYRRFIGQITRKREHVLGVQEEAMLARASELGEAPSNVYAMFQNADIRFPEVEDGEGKKLPLTVGNFVAYEQSQDRVLRRHAFETLYSVYGQFINSIGALYYANLKQADFFAKEHHYTGAMEAALDETAIPVSVYKNLIQAMNERLPLLHRYVRLRKKLLGVEELHMYDVYVPLVKCPEKPYSFEDAKRMVKQGLAPLGEAYLALLQEGFDHRWIDVYENRGKRTGAYSWGSYGSHPYVLLNYRENLDNVFTLAHEMGHALHSWHSNHAQPYLYAGCRIFVAEVASTCNEALLIHDLLKRSDDAGERRYLINHFLEQFKSTMYRQTMFAEFEMMTHGIVSEGGVLTAEQICEIYLNLNKKYFGDAMISDPQIAYEWARIPHFYTPFYVYQYATGFAAAIAISSKILRGEPGIVEKYKKFLSGGSSMDPIDLLRICGVDMATSQPVHAALDVFEEYLTELEHSVAF